MNLVRTELSVNGGRVGEFEQSWQALQNVARSQKGFVRSHLVNSIGSPMKYASLGVWQDYDSLLAYLHSSQRAGAVPSVLGLTTVTRPLEAYELVLGAGSADIAGAAYGTLVDWQVEPAQQSEFEASRKTVFELRQKFQDGFVSNRLWRNAGRGQGYVITQAYSSMDGVDKAAQHPEIVAFAKENGAKFAASARGGERYRIVTTVLA